MHLEKIALGYFKINKHRLLNLYLIIAYADSILTRTGSCFRGKTLEHESIESVIFFIFST
jgi:hypothetical protein